MKVNITYCEKYRVPRFARVLYWLGAVKLYHISQGYKGVGTVDGIWRKWHPLTWLCWIGMIIPCALAGEKIMEAFKFELSDYYKNNLKWVNWKEFE